jgi:hypothetical protein
MVLDRNVGERDALFNLRSLADVRQVQIVLCENDPAEPENREAKNKRLERNCFHDCGDNPSQIFGASLPDNYTTNVRTRADHIAAASARNRITLLAWNRRIFVYQN